MTSVPAWHFAQLDGGSHVVPLAMLQPGSFEQRQSHAVQDDVGIRHVAMLQLWHATWAVSSLQAVPHCPLATARVSLAGRELNAGGSSGGQLDRIVAGR